MAAFLRILKIHSLWVICLISIIYSSLCQSTEIITAYVLYGQASNGEPVPMARVIIDGTDKNCPDLMAKSASITMTTRINPDPKNFPITVCEAVYPFSQVFAVGSSGLLLPSVNSKISNLTVFGDTGCKPSDQDCSLNSADWAFPSLIRAAANATTTPDIVLHMGDYNYSGTPGHINITNVGKVSIYDAGDNTTQGMCKIPGPYYGQNSIGSDFPDSWEHWQSDFFKPAQPMFSVAPWIFTRGNHELCSRAGPGWFYLLDPNSSLLGKYQQQLSCPAANNPYPEVFLPPYVINLTGLNLAVLDSTNACDSGLLNANSYNNQFSLMNQLIRNADTTDPTWIQTHRPFWGVEELDENGSCGPESDQYCMTTQTLQFANNQRPIPDNVDLILSGHMHRFQVLDFKSPKHPDQFVIGNSGVKLSSLYPKTTVKLKVDNHKATVMGLKQFGYMTFSISSNRTWQGQLLNPDLSQPVLLNCDAKDKPICQAPKN